MHRTFIVIGSVASWYWLLALSSVILQIHIDERISFLMFVLLLLVAAAVRIHFLVVGPWFTTSRLPLFRPQFGSFIFQYTFLPLQKPVCILYASWLLLPAHLPIHEYLQSPT